MSKVLLINKNSSNIFNDISLSGVSFEVISFDRFDVTNSDYDLYIIEMDFSDAGYVKSVSELLKANEDENFWAVARDCDRGSIVRAYNIGFKNIMSAPVESEIIEQYFKSEEDIVESDMDYFSNKENLIIQNSRVLILDDNETNIFLLKKTLSVFNLNVTSFSSPDLALENVLSNQYDLILLDVMMPKIDGFEFAKRLKENDINKNTPIVFISALSESKNKVKGFNLGSHAYIEKPFNIKTLRAQILNILKIKKLQDDKDTFIAMLTHDLKTPIQAQSRALNLLLKNNFGELNTSQSEIIREILNSCNFMSHMAENLLLRYKYDNGKLNIRKEKNSFKKLIEQTSDKLKYLLEPKNQVLKVVYNAGVDDLEFDSLEISRVLDNLITNASEHSDEGQEIILKIDNSEDFLQVSIIDSGMGIEKQNLNHLFDKYMTGAKKFRKIGFGLGLYVTKKIIEDHDGVIQVESELGKGSRFTFKLPLTKVFAKTS